MRKNHLALTLRLMGIAFLAILFAACHKTLPADNNLGPYNLDVTLFPSNLKDARIGSFGFIKFRQNPDTARIITLDTYLNGLLPHHAYLLQRAVNPITDSSCSSTAWLTLGLGLVPQSIHTDAKGNGHEELFRAVTSIARDTEFHIHFQVVDSVTSMAVLGSDCYQYTVR